jgi:hypothetical protein
MSDNYSCTSLFYIQINVKFYYERGLGNSFIGFCLNDCFC